MMNMRDSPDFLLNIEDLDEVQEMLDAYIYHKGKELFISGITDNHSSVFAEKRIKREIWDFFKDEYFKDME